MKNKPKEKNAITRSVKMKNKTRSTLAIFVGIIFAMVLWLIPVYVLGWTKGTLFIIAYSVFVYCVGTLLKNISKGE